MRAMLIRYQGTTTIWTRNVLICNVFNLLICKLYAEGLKVRAGHGRWKNMIFAMHRGANNTSQAA